MADNRPTAGTSKPDKTPKTMEELQAEQKEQKSEGGTQEPLTSESTEPQRDPTVQAAADLELEQSRGRTFGDITSSSGDNNTRGLHGRDGGVTGAPEGGGVHNPVASEAAIEPETPEDDEGDVVENAKQ